MEKTQIKSRLFHGVFFLGIILSIFPIAVSAATLTISPSSGTYSVGTQFTVSVSVSSPDQSMNAVSGAISFSTKNLRITSISKADSIVSLWTVDPTFSNTDGTVNFEGIVLNPGFIGSDGKIISITFAAKSAGDASVTFDSGSVLANDGIGTSLPTNFINGRFTLTPALQTPQSATTTVVSVPLSVSVSVPAITYYPSTVYTSSAIVVRGTSEYADSTVLVWLKYDGEAPENYSVLNNRDGSFTFAETSGAQEGDYQMWVQAVDENGALSSSSPVYTISAVSPFEIIIGSFHINIFVGLGILFLLVLFFALWIQQMLVRRYKTKHEIVQTVMAANNIAMSKFNYFNEYVNAQLDELEKDKRLKKMAGSQEVIENIRKHIADFKDFIEKKK